MNKHNMLLNSTALLAHLSVMKSSLAAGPFNCFLNTKDNETLNSHEGNSGDASLEREINATGIKTHIFSTNLTLNKHFSCCLNEEKRILT